jgi:HlyD family secretion protein
VRLTTKMQHVLVKAAIAVVAIIALIGGWRYFGADSANGEHLYQTQRISRGVVEKSVSASGAVKALVTVDVGSQLSGPIDEMTADFNSTVKQGDLLAVIDQAPFEAKQEAAAANLAIAKADVGLREAQAAKLRKQLAQLERDVARYKALAPSAGVSRQQLDQTETQSAATRDDLAAAQAQLDSAKATVTLRQAELAQAEINLRRTLIKSPISGVVIDRRMQRGQTVTAEYQTPVLFQIAQDLSQILILAQVDEADIGAVHIGDAVTFSVEAFPDETFFGVVDQVRLAAAKTSGVVTYTVVVRAQNPEMRLFPDMTATVRIVTERRENALNIANEAVRFRPATFAADNVKPNAGQTQIWILDANNAVRQRQVRLGAKGDATTEILEGELQPGDRAILRARDAVRPEDK